MFSSSTASQFRCQRDNFSMSWSAGGHFVKKFKKIARNAIESEFRTSKMADGSHFVKIFPKKVEYRSEMARNAIKSEFRTSKMADGSLFSKFPKQLKLHIDLKWPEMRSKVNFGHPK